MTDDGGVVTDRIIDRAFAMLSEWEMAARPAPREWRVSQDIAKAIADSPYMYPAPLARGFHILGIPGRVDDMLPERSLVLA